MARRIRGALVVLSNVSTLPAVHRESRLRPTPYAPLTSPHEHPNDDEEEEARPSPFLSTNTSRASQAHDWQLHNTNFPLTRR